MPLALFRRRPDGDESTLPPIRETDLDRILKLIPTESLAFYAAAAPVMPDVPCRYFPFVLFLAGVVLTPLILYLDGGATQQAAAWPQYIGRMLCFCAWANVISWPFAPWTSAHDLSWVRSLGVLMVPIVGALALRDKLPAAPPP